MSRTREKANGVSRSSSEHLGFAVAENLSKRYRNGTLAVDGIDLHIAQGEILGLLGPNGAGKSTTIGMFTTRIPPTSGRVQVDGIDVTKNPTDVRRIIGLVSQANALDRSLTVSKVLFFHGLYFGMKSALARSQVTEMVERFGLDEVRDSPVGFLSGGMARRLMLAKAMMHRPRLLVLDEPTTGLDPPSRLAFWDFLRELNEDGLVILLATNYMEEAERLCHRVAIIDHGKLLAVDTPAELMRSVKHEAEVQMTVGGNPERFIERMNTYETVSECRGSGEGVVIARLTRTQGFMQYVLDAMIATDSTVADLSITPSSLEAVFFELTGRGLRP